MESRQNTPAFRQGGALRRSWIFIAIVGLAVAIRLAAVAAFPMEPVSDASDYHGLALRLTRGLGFVTDQGEPTAFRLPAYPVFLAGVYSVLGADARKASAAQALLGGVTVALLIGLTRQVVGNAEAQMVGILAAIYPGLVWLPRVLLSENLVMPLLLLSLCGAAALLETRRFVWAVVTGCSLALATLTRASSLFLVPLLCVGVLVGIARETNRRRACGATLALIVAYCVCLAPWAYRNQQVLEHGPLLSTSGGITLYASYWPPRVGAKRIWGNIPGVEDPVVANASRAGNEAAASAQLTRVTVGRLMAKPGLFFSLWPVKTMWLLAPFDWDWFPRRPAGTRSFNLAYVLLLMLAGVGFVCLMSRPRKRQWLLWLLPAAVMLQTLIFYGGPRFRLPAESSLLVLAGVGLVGAPYGVYVRRLSAGLQRHGRTSGSGVNFLEPVKGLAYSALDTLTLPWGLNRTINGRRWRLSAKCWRAFPEDWEADLDRFFDATVQPGMIVADVGAHVGIHTLSLAARVGCDGHVYAFEPVPHVAALLRRHIKLNRLADRVTIVEKAVGELDGQAEMHVAPRGMDPGNSCVARPYAPALTRLTVNVVRLARFFEERHQRPNVIKIDVEGYELRVLKGTAELIAGEPESILACALHPWHLQELGESEEEFFREADRLGLEVVTLDGRPARPEGTYREVVLRRPSGR
jgi:FkbM family methyltransferase